MLSVYKKFVVPDWKNSFLSLFIIITCFFLFYLFPSDDFLQNTTKSVFFFLLIPFFYVKFFLKKNFRDFGFNLKNKKEGFLWGGLMFFVLALIFFLLIRYWDFEKNYLLPAFATTSFGYFLYYELVLVNLIFLFQEIFFKGFALSALRETMGYWSILIQTVIFLFPVLILSQYFLSVLPMVLLSFLGGYIAYRTRSFFYSYLFGLTFLILLDAYIIFLNKQIL